MTKIEWHGLDEETPQMRAYRAMVEAGGGAIQFMKRGSVRWTATSSNGDSYGWGSLANAVEAHRGNPSFPNAIFTRVLLGEES